MKINNLYKVCGALFLGAVTLTGCSDDETYDIQGSNFNRVFFDPNAAAVQTNDIYVTPAGVFGVVGGNFSVKAQYPTEASISVSADVDNSLVDVYNKANSTEYQALPAEALNALNVEPTVIKPGTSVGDTTLNVTVPTEACGSLTAENYLLPLRLKVNDVQQNGSNYEVGVRDTFNTVYAVIHNAGSDYVYLPGSMEQTCAIVNTPVGIFGGVNATFNVAVRANGNTSFQVKAEVDNSLIAAYNQEHGSNYQAVPENIASQFTISDGQIPAGALQTNPGVTVLDPNGAAKQLKGEYLLPLKLTFVYPNGSTQPLDNAYVKILTKSSLINDDADGLNGTVVTTAQKKASWKCISATGGGLKADEFSSMFHDGWTAIWKFHERDSKAEIVIDLGAVHNVTAFNLASDVMESATVQLSADNSSWTNLGSTAGHRTLTQRQGYSNYEWYVLYGAVKTRYVKMTLELNENYWGWNYISWGRYCSINSIGLVYQD